MSEPCVSWFVGRKGAASTSTVRRRSASVRREGFARALNGSVPRTTLHFSSPSAVFPDGWVVCVGCPGVLLARATWPGTEKTGTRDRGYSAAPVDDVFREAIHTASCWTGDNSDGGTTWVAVRAGGRTAGTRCVGGVSRPGEISRTATSMAAAADNPAEIRSTRRRRRAASRVR